MYTHFSYSGKPENFTLQFRPSENFPLDVYLLLDVTGSFSRRFRDTVTPLATELGICIYCTYHQNNELIQVGFEVRTLNILHSRQMLVPI